MDPLVPSRGAKREDPVPLLRRFQLVPAADCQGHMFQSGIAPSVQDGAKKLPHGLGFHFPTVAGRVQNGLQTNPIAGLPFRAVLRLV